MSYGLRVTSSSFQTNGYHPTGRLHRFSHLIVERADTGEEVFVSLWSLNLITATTGPAFTIGVPYNVYFGHVDAFGHEALSAPTLVGLEGPNLPSFPDGCGNVLIDLRPVYLEALDVEAVDLEMRVVESQAVIGSLTTDLIYFFRAYGAHDLPINTDLEFRTRYRTGVGVGPWSVWTPFFIDFVWEDCFEPASEGVRRILFGQVGVDSDPLEVGVSSQRRILFGQPG